MSTVSRSSRRAPDSRALHITLWVLRVLVALVLIGSGTGKLLGIESEIIRFDRIGLGQWFRYVAGVLEVAGGLAILIPGYAGLGALVAAAVMLGALVTQLTRLDGSLVPLGLALIAGFVAWSYRGDILRRPGPSPEA